MQVNRLETGGDLIGEGNEVHTHSTDTQRDTSKETQRRDKTRHAVAMTT